MIQFVSAVLALGVLTISPQQNRQLDQISVGTGTIVGTVTDDRTGLPISGAVVSISGTTHPPTPEVTTDGDGQFVFAAVAAGRYSISAKHGGYFDGSFGQRQPLGPGTSLTLSTGERRSGANVTLVRPAAITGTVLDDAGEPVVKLEVRAYARSYLGGRPHFSELGSGLTDDRGAYRIGLLPAGDYIVGVPVTRPRAAADAEPDAAIARDGGAVSQLPPAANGRAELFPSSYFPAGVAASAATVVSVAFGELHRNVDLQVRPAPGFRIRGTVLLKAGAKRGIRVKLTAVDEEMFEGSDLASTVVSDDGSFAVGGVPPGQYILRVDTPEAWATEMISISDDDLGDIHVQMHDPLQVTGRLEFSGSRPDPDSETIQQLQLSVERADGVTLPGKPETGIDRTGHGFSIRGLMPGRYVVRMNRGLPSWYLRAVMYQGRDVSQSGFDITSSDITGLTATFTDRPPSITGRVTGAADTGDVMVFVFPQDQQRWVDFGSEGRGFRAVSIQSGAFEVLDLPAGDYIAVAIVGDTSLQWRQPSFLQQAARLGSPVRVTDGTNTQIELKVTVIR